nr:hypothetical protein [Elusimicrobiota bacterium]
EFFQHLPKINFLVVEVEKDSIDAVYYYLKESINNIFKEPTREIVEDLVIDKTGTVIVKAIISESPLIKTDGVQVPSLEKILVDILAEKKLFYFLQGNELVTIYKNAFDKYTIQHSKLIRYAKRRGKEIEVNDILKQINGNNI